MLEQIAGAGRGVFAVPAAHRAAVLEGPERGEVMTAGEMAVLWRKCGL